MVNKRKSMNRAQSNELDKKGTSHIFSMPRFGYSGDPLAVLFLDRWKLTPLHVGLLVALVMLGTDLGLAYFYDYLFSKGQVVGLFNDWGLLIVDVILTPVFWAYYLWMPLAIQRLFSEFRETNAITVTDNQLKEIYHTYGRSQWTYISVLASIGVIICGLLFLSSGAWWQVSITATSIKALGWWLSSYVICMLTIREILTVKNLWHLFSHGEIRIRVFHPDKACGLAPVGDWAINVRPYAQ